MEFKELRIKRGLSQSDIADRLGVPDRTWRRWENAESKIPSDILPQIQKILGLSDSQLLNALKTQKKAKA